MKVVHLCLGSFYPDGFSYQENMLPKFHKQQGHDVEVIASLQSFDSQGKVCYIQKPSTYENEYNIKVVRLAYQKPEKIYHKMKRYIGTYAALSEAKPEVLFIHGCQFQDMDQIVKYLKQHPGIKVFVDNHADALNSGKNFFSMYILHKIFWRRTAHLILPYTEKFYGVLPVRVDWLIDQYKLPPKKCELLVMGADDDAVKNATSKECKSDVRKRYGIDQNDFLIVTGGKIDSNKSQTLNLMKAIKEINNPKIRMLLFGSITPELKDDVLDLVDGYKIQYIGWAKGNESYNYFAAADLVIFPGLHSVYWEQVAGLGVPMVVRRRPGTEHIDIGGNVIFFDDDEVNTIKAIIENLIQKPDDYKKMFILAQGKGKQFFSYNDIAIRAIGG